MLSVLHGRAEALADDEDVKTDLESILNECIGGEPAHGEWLGIIAAVTNRSSPSRIIAIMVVCSLPFRPGHRGPRRQFPSRRGMDENGGARINKPEAKALVADIVAGLNSPGFNESRLTIGVVTFDTEQIHLIWICRAWPRHRRE